MTGVLSLNGTFTYPIEILKTLTVDDAAVFRKSIIIGEGSSESNKPSLTVGPQGTSAKGDYSIAVGINSITNQKYSMACGVNTKVEADGSIALGANSKSISQNSFIWSGVKYDSDKYYTGGSSIGDGVFCINPKDPNGIGRPEDGFYIGDKKLATLIREYAIDGVQSNENSFSEDNTFNGNVTIKGEMNIKSGPFTLDEGAEMSLFGKVNINREIPDGDSSELAANTRFVTESLNEYLRRDGGVMYGDLTLNRNPVDAMHAATKDYVDGSVSKIVSTSVSVDNSPMSNGKEIAKIKVNDRTTSIYSQRIVAGQNTSVRENADGSVTIGCSPNISTTGGTIKVPVGTIIPFAGNGTPDGFLFCDGRELSRIQYSELFSAIGTSFGGGDGVTTFNIPRINDNRFLEGSDINGDYISAGIPTPTLNTSNLKCSSDGEHSHYYDVGLGSCTCSTKTSVKNSHNRIGWRPETSASGKHTHTITGDFSISSGGVYGNSNTVQPKSLTVRYYIKCRKTADEVPVLSINGNKPDLTGNITINESIKSVNGNGPDENGDINVPVGIKTINNEGPDNSGNLIFEAVMTVNEKKPEQGNVTIDTGIHSINGHTGTDVTITIPELREIRTLLWGSASMQSLTDSYCEGGAYMANENTGWVKKIGNGTGSGGVYLEGRYNWRVDFDSAYNCHRMVLSDNWSSYKYIMVIAGDGTKYDETTALRFSVSDMKFMATNKNRDYPNPVNSRNRLMNILGYNKGASNYWLIDIGASYINPMFFYSIEDDKGYLSSIWGINVI